jgi:hypothetical protein
MWLSLSVNALIDKCKRIFQNVIKYDKDIQLSEPGEA